MFRYPEPEWESGAVRRNNSFLQVVVMALMKVNHMISTPASPRLFLYIAHAALFSLFLIHSSCRNPFGYDEDMNDAFWSNNPEMRKPAREKMESAKENLHTIEDVRQLQKQFRYVAEPTDWIPTIEVLFARDLTDDCDGAAVLGQWSLAQIGMESRIAKLYGNGTHTVCISNDNTIMITNSEVVAIPPHAWKEAVLTWFRPPYSTLREVHCP